MEELSAPGKPQPEPQPQRLPGLEMARGLLYAAFTFTVFMFVQMAVLIWRILALTPSLAKEGFSLQLLDT
ncbi:MAG: hypothetical protein JST98_01815, partial [Bacteroidetes bacterium]|nr:hypothetical protein [Bacteroidota bacterium]